MPKTGLRQTFDLETRDRYTKVECELGMTVNGRELPNMEVLGKALDAAAELIQQKIKEAYQKVPERVEQVSNVTQPAPVVQPVTPVQVTPPAEESKPAIPSFGS